VTSTAGAHRVGSERCNTGAADDGFCLAGERRHHLCCSRHGVVQGPGEHVPNALSQQRMFSAPLTNLANFFRA
jgi:hypothetical protein